MVVKLNINDIRKMINEAVLRSTSWRPVFDGMEKLGFSQIMGANDYNGNPRWNIGRFKIKKDNYTPEIEKKVEQLLNRCGWRIFQKKEKYYDFYGDGPFVAISIESERGEKVNGDWIFYHATPSNRVNKILRNGLCPRDEGKRGEWRGPRVYLSQDNDRWLFNNLFKDDDYEVFKVDLRGSGIQLYKDEYAEGGFYTLENIPPSRLELVANPQKEVVRKRNEFADYLEANLAGYDFSIKRGAEPVAKGMVDGVSFVFKFNLFGGVSYTGKPYEIRMYRKTKRPYQITVGFHEPGEAINWVMKQIKKIA